MKLFTNYSYEVFDRHLQVYTEWGTKQTYKIAKKTQVRLKGGIKSPILREMEEGEQVELLEQMETWSKVKTSDSIIGYVENKRLTDVDTEVETPVTDYVPEEYTSIALDGKVCLGFHSIGGPGGGKGNECHCSDLVQLYGQYGNFPFFCFRTVCGKGTQLWIKGLGCLG